VTFEELMEKVKELETKVKKLEAFVESMMTPEEVEEVVSIVE
jgi:hypothetical protein